MDFFYRDKPWYAGQFVRKVIPKFSCSNISSILYFTTLLNKQKQTLLSVLVRNVDKVFLNTKITLPTKNNKIDFDFMEKFIAKLEAERIAELEAYLSAAGLKDYNLTDAEQQMLDQFEKNEWREYNLGEIFKIESSAKRFDANKIKIENIGNPYVVRTSSNNGIKGYINQNKEFLNEGNTISFGQDTATMFYQPNPYFTGDKIKILKANNNLFNKTNAMFFISAMTKSFSLFSWGASNFNVDIISNQKIKLLSKNGKTDFASIEIFISAIQKLVIKDVVLYTQSKLDATKSVIEQKNK